VSIAPDEIFVSDGSKSDSGNIQEIFAADATVALTDPVYPVYLVANVMAGRAGTATSGAVQPHRLPALHRRERFQPPVPDRPVDMVYLCFPNNPTGSVLTKPALKAWVDWARADGPSCSSTRLRGYIRDPEIPHSIYEVEGAREVAIEFRSFSKSAGSPAPAARHGRAQGRDGRTAGGERVPLNGLWLRRQSTKFNSVPYVIQKAAAAVYTDEGQREVRGLVDFYMENAQIIRSGLESTGLTVYGGPQRALHLDQDGPRPVVVGFLRQAPGQAHVVGTPGSGSGRAARLLPADGIRLARPHEEAISRIKTSPHSLTSPPAARAGEPEGSADHGSGWCTRCDFHTSRRARQGWE